MKKDSSGSWLLVLLGICSFLSQNSLAQSTEAEASEPDSSISMFDRTSEPESSTVMIATAPSESYSTSFTSMLMTSSSMEESSSNSSMTNSSVTPMPTSGMVPGTSGSSLQTIMTMDPSPTATSEAGSGASVLNPMNSVTVDLSSETPSVMASPTPSSTPTTSSTVPTTSTTSTPTTSQTTPTQDHPSPTTEEVTTSTEDDTSSDGAGAAGGSGSGNVVGAVIGAIFAVIIVGLLVAILLLCYCYYKHHCVGKSYFVKQKSMELLLLENGKFTNTEELFAHLEDKRFVVLGVEELKTHVNLLAENDGFKAEEEYSATREMDPEASMYAATLSCNESKNRYINILARDDTRVMLKSGKGSDYINANYVEGFHKGQEYIACQGPLPDTVVDFWKMVWEQRSSVIVMVTNPTENEVVKCETYWPVVGSMQYGSYVVKVESEILFPEFIIRHFTLILLTKNRKEEGRRSVTQFHFTAWPDFGVPQDPSSMLKFVRGVRHHMSRSDIIGPVVVHCSAGVGRTGTFMGVDMLTQKMEDAREKGRMEELKLSVQEVVCKMRAQRGNMVQTSAQYLFIYNSLLHVHTHGRTDVRQKNLKDHIQKLATPISEDSDRTWLDKEFDHVQNVKIPVDSFFTVATEFYNESKNRNMDNIPFDHNRVMLDGKESDEEDYVNASYIDGYYNRVEFICTDHPLPHTRNQFWTMLVERSIDVLVVFGSVKNPEDRYWPEEKEILKLNGDITIVGEEADTDDEEEEERGGEGDTEEDEEGKNNKGSVDEKNSKVSKSEEDGAEEQKKEESVKEGESGATEKDDKKVKEADEVKETDEVAKEKETKEGGDTMKKKEEDKKPDEEVSKKEDDKKVLEPKQEENESPKKAKDDNKLSNEAEQKEKENDKDEDKNGEAKKEGTGSQSDDSNPSETPTKNAPEGKNIEEAKSEGETPKVNVSVKDESCEENLTAGDITLHTDSGNIQLNVELRSKSPQRRKNKPLREKDFLIIRNFTVTIDEVSQSVKMYQLVGWPSEGVPESADIMLQFLLKSRDMWKNTGFNSILLHTASGVQDEVSGVYCALCVLLRMMQVEQEVDMVTTCERLRLQRPGILKNKEFYMYIYKALAKALEED